MMGTCQVRATQKGAQTQGNSTRLGMVFLPLRARWTMTLWISALILWPKWTHDYGTGGGHYTQRCSVVCSGQHTALHQILVTIPEAASTACTHMAAFGTGLLPRRLLRAQQACQSRHPATATALACSFGMRSPI